MRHFFCLESDFLSTDIAVQDERCTARAGESAIACYDG